MFYIQNFPTGDKIHFLKISNKRRIFEVMKRKNLQPRIFYPVRLSFRFNEEIKSFTDKQKLREFSTTKPALQQMLKKLL